MIITVYAVSISLILLAYSDVIILAMLLMLLMGLVMIFQMASPRTLLRSIVADEMRSRILSLYTMAVMSISPLGSFVIGTLASIFGVHWSLASYDVVCILWSLYNIRISPKIIRGIQRTLILSTNRSIYRTPKWILEQRMIK